MNDEANKTENAVSLRRKIFVVGSVATLVLCGLVVLCVPPKPAIIAQDARTESLGQQVPATASETTDSPQGPSSLRGGTTGARLYARFCAGCHGADGKAQTTMARMMKSPPTNLADGPWKGPQTSGAIIEIVKNGKGAMPAYSKEITTDGELESLAQHVLSLRSEQSK